MESDITTADVPTADLDQVIGEITEYLDRATSQVMNLVEVVILFDRKKLATGFARPQHDGPTDLAAAKLVSAVAGLKYAGVQLIEAFVARERAISPAPVGPGWN